ncbi:carboxymuconolactone decarboxylase family protein (plasmid) [Rhodococcoides fascians A21d2]|uniref:carboxymuconolactone decarboxylase family protein n=1 Tax=Rhodococcoides fascians TaxID=1828 RepID=UPI0013EF17BE|nr:carboxymuconolactone decarboxylase family protein [Rhodococcus fascians A21d2]
MIIIRVAHLRNRDYELDHHLRLGRSAGVDTALADALINRPTHERTSESTQPVESLQSRDATILNCVDELVLQSDLSDRSWVELFRHFTDAQKVCFVLLVGNYVSLATTIAALRIQSDFGRSDSKCDAQLWTSPDYIVISVTTGTCRFKNSI